MHSQQKEEKRPIDPAFVGFRFTGARETERRVALSRWTLWRMEADGRFVTSVKVGNKRLWVESEVEDWMRARIAERG
jgi:predicted DNA-binding transcriptional regulator AlpA